MTFKNNKWTIVRRMQIVFSHSSAALVGTGLLKSHSTRHTTVGRAPLDERSARRRDLYMTTHNTHKRQTSMPLAGFEPAIPASEWPHTLALDHFLFCFCIFLYFVCTSSVLVSLSWLSCTLPFRLYLQHTTRTSMRLAGFELATPGSDQPQTPALDRSATGMDSEDHPVTGHEGLEEE